MKTRSIIKLGMSLVVAVGIDSLIPSAPGETVMITAGAPVVAAGMVAAAAAAGAELTRRADSHSGGPGLSG